MDFLWLGRETCNAFTLPPPSVPWQNLKQKRQLELELRNEKLR